MLDDMQNEPAMYVLLFMRISILIMFSFTFGRRIWRNKTNAQLLTKCNANENGMLENGIKFYEFRREREWCHR